MATQHESRRPSNHFINPKQHPGLFQILFIYTELQQKVKSSFTQLERFFWVISSCNDDEPRQINIQFRQRFNPKTSLYIDGIRFSNSNQICFVYGYDQAKKRGKKLLTACLLPNMEKLPIKN